MQGNTGGSSLIFLKYLRLQNHFRYRLTRTCRRRQKDLKGRTASAYPLIPLKETIKMKIISPNVFARCPDLKLCAVSGLFPKKIVSEGSIKIYATTLADLNFLQDTNYFSDSNIFVSGCRVNGEENSVNFRGNFISAKVLNPLKFFSVINHVSLSLPPQAEINDKCNLNPKFNMSIPFNGRIKDTSGNFLDGYVTSIKIINLVSNLSEFEDKQDNVFRQRQFSGGMFSETINAFLYVNSMYKIEFRVCNSSNNCEDFSFNFFTWKKLW